ncbi:MAG: hypothetical protein JXQ89_19495 [Pelagimonas sp.]
MAIASMRGDGQSYSAIGRKVGRTPEAVRQRTLAEGYAKNITAKLKEVAELGNGALVRGNAKGKRRRLAVPPAYLHSVPVVTPKQAPQDDHLIARHGAALVAEVRGVPKHSKQASLELAAIAARHGLQGPAVRTLWHRVAS